MAGLVVGVWAVLPPFSGPELNTELRVEVADHAVPGALVLLVSLAAVALVPRLARPASALLVAGLVVFLAGFWMVATHVPLVAQALGDEAPVGATVYHALPGVAVAVLGAVWAGSYWGAASPGE
ncbi:MAG: hypothetical protein ACRDZ9_09920 [Acidimicrobiales bacterium]